MTQLLIYCPLAVQTDMLTPILLILWLPSCSFFIDPVAVGQPFFTQPFSYIRLMTLLAEIHRARLLSAVLCCAVHI